MNDQKLTNTFVVTLIDSDYDKPAVSVEVQKFWGAIDSPMFDARVRLMMTENGMDRALLLHFNAVGSVRVVAGWN